MLLNHTSGLAGSTYLNSFGYEINGDYRTMFMANMARSTLRHEPGELAAYCNDGFTLAQYLVEEVSGMSYMDFLQSRILEPLGMKDTGESVGADALDRTIAVSYMKDSDEHYPNEAVTILGAGGLASTAEDLCRLGSVFFKDSGIILSEQAREEMLREQPGFGTIQTRRQPDTYGLGWDSVSYPAYEEQGVKVLSKNGATGNYMSQLYVLPDEKIVVAMIAAGDSANLGKRPMRILNTVLGTYGLYHEPETTSAPLAEATAIPDEYAAYSGFYQGRNDTYYVDFQYDDGLALIYNYQGLEKTLLFQLQYGEDFFYYDTVTCYFLESGGRRFFVQQDQDLGLDSLVAERLEPCDIQSGFAGRLGEGKWLIRNMLPFEAILFSPRNIITPYFPADLPGYVEFYGMKRIESDDYAGYAVSSVSDLNEMTLFGKDGLEYVQLSEMLYSPAELAGVLHADETEVTIGADGYNEWLIADADCQIQFTQPENNRLIVYNDDGVVFDSLLYKTAETDIQKGSYLQIIGYAGDTTVIRSQTQALTSGDEGEDAAAVSGSGD